MYSFSINSIKYLAVRQHVGRGAAMRFCQANNMALAGVETENEQWEITDNVKLWLGNASYWLGDGMAGALPAGLAAYERQAWSSWLELTATY